MIKEYAKICLFVLLSLCLCGCATLPQDYFAYCEKSFCAEVQGVMRGCEFSAVVSLSRESGKSCVGVRYLSPASLCGLEVSAECDQNDKPIGRARLLRDGWDGDVDAETVMGVLTPVLSLLSRGEVASVRYEAGLCCLTFADGGMMVLDEEGAPKSVQNEQIELAVRWLEWTADFDLSKK